MKIRPAVESDVTAIKLIEQEGSLAPWTERDYRAETIREGSEFLVAEEEGNRNVIGFLIARLITRIDSIENHARSRSEFELLNVGVPRDRRNSGIGKGLFHAFLDRVQDDSVSIFLEVRKSNIGAISFYEKSGFSQIGVRKDFYRNPVEDSVLMSGIFEKCLR